MQDNLQLLFTALQISSVYILFSLGLTIIFGVLKVVNFAHGQFFTFGALVLSLVLRALAPSLGHGWAAYLLAGWRGWRPASSRDWWSTSSASSGWSAT